MTARQQKALAALLSTSSKAAAARAAGISDRTLRDYLADPTFWAEYEKAFKDMVEDAAKQAKQSLSPALSTLREIVEDKGEDTQARISAARAILSNSIKLIETADILARLKELEDVIGGRDG